MNSPGLSDPSVSAEVQTAELASSGGIYNFPAYYWRFLQHFGHEAWRHEGRDMITALVAAFGTFIISWAIGDVEANRAFKIALYSLLVWLAIFGVYRLARTPWLMHRVEHRTSKEEPTVWWHGAIGAATLLVMFAAVILIVILWYASHDATLTVIIAPHNAEQQVAIVQLRQQVADLHRQELQKQEPPQSLRRRTLRLMQDLIAFWEKRPAPRQPAQNPATDDEKIVKAAYEEYWRATTNAYTNANFNERVLGIVREYKTKGVPTGYLEQEAEQHNRLVGGPLPLGGFNVENCFIYMSDLCVLRELAYQVDAYDQPIFFSITPQK